MIDCDQSNVYYSRVIFSYFLQISHLLTCAQSACFFLVYATQERLQQQVFKTVFWL